MSFWSQACTEDSQWQIAPSPMEMPRLSPIVEMAAKSHHTSGSSMIPLSYYMKVGMINRTDRHTTQTANNHHNKIHQLQRSFQQPRKPHKNSRNPHSDTIYNHELSQFCPSQQATAKQKTTTGNKQKSIIVVNVRQLLFACFIAAASNAYWA